MYQKILKTIYYIFLTCVAAVALLLVVSFFPITGNVKFRTVLSGSMEPTIHTGSIVVVKPESRYEIGDIVTFGEDTHTQVPTTHRIVSDRAQDGVIMFTTKGDANNSSDITEVSEHDVRGKVVFDVPFAGYIIDFVRKPIGIIVVIVLPSLVIIGDEIRKIFVESKKILANKKTENKPQEYV